MTSWKVSAPLVLTLSLKNLREGVVSHSPGRTRVSPRPAGVFSRTLNAGGGADPPCLTSERGVVKRREKRQTKGVNETDLKSTKNFA